MATHANDHRLAVVLHADAAGYSRLITTDEEGTHRRLRTYVDLFIEIVNAHAGRVIDAEADSLLVEFPTAADALNGAARVQNELQARNAALPEHERLVFRIGINLADIFVDRERARLFGIGINVAARLESLAEPGTVCVSESVRSAASATLPFVFVYLGEFRLKNIATPVRAYRADPQPAHGRAESTSAVRRLWSRQATSTSASPRASVAPSARASPRETALSARLPFGVIRAIPVEETSVANASTSRVPVAAGYRTWLDCWLRWLRRRFGPRRGLQWKLFDFCLVHAFVYSSVAFFVGLVFLGGDNAIGALRVSYLEVGSAVRSTEHTALSEAPGVAGVLPVLLLVVLVHAVLVRSWERADRPPLARRETDARLLLVWSIIVLGIGFALGLTGFGAGVVALSAALGAWQLRGMPGVGAVALSISALVVAALGIIASGAARGDERLSAIAEALHDLSETDVERFLILLLLLPLLNALFDYLSWRASRRFALAVRGGSMPSVSRVGALRSRGSAREGRCEQGAGGRVLLVASWGAIDVAVGLTLLYALAACLGFAFEMLDVLRHDDGGYYDVSDIVASLVVDPSGAGFWLSITLLTTLVPTLLHLLAVGSGLTRAAIGVVGARQAAAAPTAFPSVAIALRAGTRDGRVLIPRLASLLTGAWLAAVLALAFALLGSEAFFRSAGWSMLAGAEFATIIADLVT